MFNNILVVCVGNICRSPMAEYVLRSAIESRGLNVSVSSAGLGALVDKPADPHAVEVARLKGLDINAHRARQVTEAHMKEHDLILVMETWQQKDLESRYPFVRGRVHLLGKWNKKQIKDPYQKPIEAFEMAYTDIEACIGLWCEKIWLK